jgi:hypothetical protein
MFGTVLVTGPVVLMARIVDSAGVTIRPSWIAAIEYSILEWGQCRPDALAIIVGHDCVALDVNDVLFDSLEIDGRWRTDFVGYNFRHEIALDRRGSFPKFGMSYEVRYTFTSTFGETSIVRFQLKRA